MSINPSDEHDKKKAQEKGQDQLTFLIKKYGVPRSTIDEAVRKVGRDPEAVERYITTRKE
jgi:hypothetical protein